MTYRTSDDAWLHTRDFPALKKNVESILDGYTLYMRQPIDDFVNEYIFVIGSPYSKDMVRSIDIALRKFTNRDTIYKVVTKAAMQLSNLIDAIKPE